MLSVALLALASLDPAQASGIMEPPVYKLVGEDCDAIGVETPWPAGRALRFAGQNEGFTSPPGGPGTGHIWPVMESALSLHREGCEDPVGHWVDAGRSCGAAPVLEWQGELEPGARYAVHVEGASVFTFEVEGSSRSAACPAESIVQAPYRSRSISTTTRPVTLSADLVRRQGEPEWVNLPRMAQELSAVLGYPDLRSSSEQLGSLSVPPRSPPTGSARISRTIDVGELDSGEAQHCRTQETVEVELSLEGVARVFRFEAVRELGDTAGACPR